MATTILAAPGYAIDVVTHDGVFHADEVVAIATVALAMPTLTQTVTVARSRDQKVIDQARVAVIDVGGRYEPSRHHTAAGPIDYLDHHQWQPRKGEGLRENGVAYAAAGLTWKHYGRLVLWNMGCPEKLQSKVWKAIDHKVIQGIDALDTGTMPKADGPSLMSLSGLISSFNPRDGGDFDSAFLQAVDFAIGCLERLVRNEIAAAAAYQAVFSKAIDCQSQVLVLDSGSNWQEAVIVANENKSRPIDFVVFPDPKGQWMVQCVPPALGSFEKRVPLPEAWAAKRDQELAQLTGVADAIFCHAGRFICGAQSQAGALRLATLAFWATA